MTSAIPAPGSQPVESSFRKYYNTVVKSMVFEASLPGSQVCPLLVVWPLIGHLTSVCFSLFICERGIMIVAQIKWVHIYKVMRLILKLSMHVNSLSVPTSIESAKHPQASPRDLWRLQPSGGYTVMGTLLHGTALLICLLSPLDCEHLDRRAKCYS